MSFSFNLYWIILMTSFDASVLWVGKSLNLVLTLLFVTLVREIYHPDQPDHISWPPRWPFWPPWPTQPICPFAEYSVVCQHQTIFYWPTAKYKAKLLKILRSVSFWFGLFSVFPSPPASLPRGWDSTAPGPLGKRSSKKHQSSKTGYRRHKYD